MSHDLEISSSCSPAKYTAGLEKLLSEEAAFPAPGEPPKKGTIQGQIKGNKITLYTSSLKDDHTPVFSGEVFSSNGGMILRGNFRLAATVRIHAMLFRSFTIFLSIVLAAGILYASYVHRTFDLKIILFLLLIATFCAGMLFFSSHLYRMDPGPLRKFIQRSFQSIPVHR